MKPIAARILAGLSLLVTAVAWAAPHGALLFVQPSGKVDWADSIDIQVRFTLDAGSAPLIIDSRLPNGELNPADFGADWPDEFGSVSLLTSTLSLCGGDFTGCGSDLPYRMEINIDPLGFLSGGVLAIAPGESREFSIGRFVPSVGPVASGTYTLGVFDIQLLLTGTRFVTDEFGDPTFESVSIAVPLASTCTAPDIADCAAFVRTVVPLPPMFAPTLVALIAVRRTRRRSAGR